MREDERIPKDLFQRVLARAAELDAAGPDEVTESRAREIAGEVGVSPEAWDRAWHEHTERSVPRPQQSEAPARSASSPAPRLSLWRRVLGGARRWIDGAQIAAAILVFLWWPFGTMLVLVLLIGGILKGLSSDES